MQTQVALQQASPVAKLAQMTNRGLFKTMRFARRKPLGFLGLAICFVALVLGLLPGVFTTEDPNFGGNYVNALQAPSTSHFFGTDEQGRDVYSRIVDGTRVSLKVAFFAIGIGSISGFLLGIVSGYFGGWVDMILQRIVDSMLAFPGILLALTLVAVFGGGFKAVIIAIGIVFIPGALRITRGTVLSAKENVYVDASRVIGASPLRIMLRHILPNVLAPFLVVASAALGNAILIEASLSFLGLGVPPPYPSWGRMLSGNASQYAAVAPWMVFAPGIAISVLVLGFNLFGDALRDLWDPRLRGR
ncbi:MAG: ABC transporter permease [Dehalococcoidia bacterium]|nr:ABC transporter permease [Dehalococcoidia bacterium]